MIRVAIISLAMSWLPAVTEAQDGSAESFDTAFADAHWEVIVQRCASEAVRYEQLTDDSIYHTLNGGLKTGSSEERFMLNRGTENLTDLDRYWFAFTVVTAIAVHDSLHLGVLFDADVDPEIGDAVEHERQLRNKAEASLALAECFWPTEDERVSVSESRWAEALDKLATGVCDLHFFTLTQRYIETPTAGLLAAERQAAGERIMSEHEQYLEASRDASQCGEFL